MPLEPCDDFARIADGLEAVTLLRRSGTAGTLLAHALRRAASDRDRGRSGGRYVATDTVWHLDAAELASPPRLGDVVVDAAGQRWTLLRIYRQTLLSRWRCYARNLALAHGLDDCVDVERLETVVVGGVPSERWTLWRSGVPARVQPIERIVVQYDAGPATVRRSRVFLGENLDLDHRFRLRRADGTVLGLRAVRRMSRIDRLVEVDVEEV